MPKPKLFDIARLSKAVADLKNSLPTQVEAASFTLESKIPFKLVSVRETLIHRMAELADVGLELCSTNRIVPAHLICRGILETTAVMYGLFLKLEKFLVDKDSAVLDEFIMRCLFGSRRESANHVALNVLTFIDKLDKLIPGIRKSYDNLSEFCHPNSSGVLATHSNLKTDDYLLEVGPNAGNFPIEIVTGEMFHFEQIFELYYNKSGDLIKEINSYFDSLAEA